MKPLGSRDRPVQGERVIAALLSLIEERHYRPGERLPSERDLAEQFGVGRTTVREAITTLESMRFLERRPGSGVFLTREPGEASLETLVLYSDLGLPIDPRANAESIEVRRIVEVQAIGLACERRTDEDIERLRRTLRVFEDTEAFARKASDYDYTFHINIFRATHNDILLRMVNPFYIMSKSRRAVFFKDRDRRRVSHEQHVEMLTAIVATDKDRAETLMAAHIGRVKSYFG